MPWWGWVVAVSGAGFVVLVASIRAFRKTVREEFVAFVREERPDWDVRIGGGGKIEVRRRPEDEVGTLWPHKLYAMAADLKATTAAERRPVYEKFLRVIDEADCGALDPEADRDRLLPRIVTKAALAQLRRGLGEVPEYPLGIEGLAVTLVVDSPESVRYLTPGALAELGLDAAGALELGKANLRRTFGAEVVRRAVETADVNVVKSFDSHDATRLLLVPEHLSAGESVLAMIPDRDTLVLVRPPAGGDWTAMRKLARNAAGEPLWRQPIRVTTDGFTAAEGPET